MNRHLLVRAALVLFACTATLPVTAQVAGQSAGEAAGQSNLARDGGPGRSIPANELAENVFKNVQVLKGVSVGEFMDTMGFFSASLGLNCVQCHVDDSLTHWEKFAEDTPRKQMARRMILMVNSMNQANFGGRRMLTCYSCHRGSTAPETVPSLMVQYELPVEDPNAVEIAPDIPSEPTAEQILGGYIQALGGTERLASITSLVGKGSYTGYDSYEQAVPFEIFAKAQDQRATVIHTQNGDTVTTFDGRAGWVAAVDKPVTLLPLNPGSELDGARLEADLLFPAHLKDALHDWRVGFPPTTIDEKQVQIVQGTGDGGTRIKLYFDMASGLLTRTVRYTNTIVGVVPTQIDYDEYKDVAGIKMPFRWVVTWTDGRSTFELTDVQVNRPVDNGRFSQPAPAVVKKAVQPPAN